MTMTREKVKNIERLTNLTRSSLPTDIPPTFARPSRATSGHVTWRRFVRLNTTGS